MGEHEVKGAKVEEAALEEEVGEHMVEAVEELRALTLASEHKSFSAIDALLLDCPQRHAQNIIEWEVLGSSWGGKQGVALAAQRVSEAASLLHPPLRIVEFINFRLA